MPYEPKSLDLTRVEIPADLTNLAEQLAKITHDNWLNNVWPTAGAMDSPGTTYSRSTPA